ncbi:MAG TPA: helix-turn-helix transcriptional regulator [Clostridiales bacterium]|nr:helix-turn-helix transcriptional regulator [Clostridiales bacterium]HOL92210.1 helix-turn-helix transcriptional regulator [Clostridiales bacterium]HPP35807.1 helix-turn-helix transcriptional regulator [Clostridiales bacterium]
MLHGKNIFENIFVKNLISHVNYCAPDWGETDCSYGYNKFYYFIEGDATLIIEGDEYHPEPEELFLIPADTRHTYYHDPVRPVYKYWCHFDLRLNEGRKLVYSKYGAKCRIPRETIVPVFEKLISSYNSADPRDTLSEKAALLEILRLFMDNVDYVCILPENTDDFIAAVDEYIVRNIGSAITLQGLAGIVHLHPNYFIQYFRKRYNVSPMEHVKILRLEKAAQLLVQHPEQSVGEIAMEVGFRDYRYFGRIFRKRYGITPSTYKRLAGGK